MWLLGNRAFVVQHILSSVEQPLVQTDSRMCVESSADEISDDEWELLLESGSAGAG